MLTGFLQGSDIFIAIVSPCLRMKLFWDEVIRQGGSVRGAEAYDPQQTDFARTIRKLVGTHYAVPDDLKAGTMVQVEEDPYFQIPIIQKRVWLLEGLV